MMNNKRHTGFAIFFAITILIFLWKVITMQGTYIMGDFLVQFYPWSKVYSESIKDLGFPFWCRYFHSGFPLMAEGQIGGFYPLNIIMFLLLPFKFAYNYSLILHFVLAGIFTYFYTRRLGAGQWGGALAALLFCFGSAYAGCFYNIATLRTLIWFPLVLLLMERTSQRRRRSGLWPRTNSPLEAAPTMIICGLIAGMQFLAGFPQMAAYSFVIYIIYLLYNLKLKKAGLKDSILAVFLFTVFCIIVALPQVILTYQLSQLTARSSATLGFALWKSFLPPAILNAVFPRWMAFLGYQLYIGVFSILFLIYGVMHSRRFQGIRPLLLVGIIAFLAALGRYNPLYVALLKLTRFYTFRNPSKFLFFSLFAASVLSGFGFSRFFNHPDKKLIRSAATIFAGIIAVSTTIFFSAKLFIYLFKDRIISWLQGYTATHIAGRPYHRYDLQTYLDKAQGIYMLLVKSTDFGNFFVLFSVVIAMVALLMVISILYRRPVKMKLLRVAIFSIIFLDLFVYSFHGVGFTNVELFNQKRAEHPKILEILQSDKELFRVMPFDLQDESLPYWIRPNANILKEIDTIAAYTPLAEKDYRDALSSLEVVDDSLGLLSPSEQALIEKYPILKLLNVKYIVSGKNLKYRFLKRIASDEGVFLYGLRDYLPRVFFTQRIGQQIRKSTVEYLKVIEYRSGFTRIEVSTRRDGFLVFSENYYPGWTASVDGKAAEIIPVKGMVQAVKVDKGKHQVIFKFRNVIASPKGAKQSPFALRDAHYGISFGG